MRAPGLRQGRGEKAEERGWKGGVAEVRAQPAIPSSFLLLTKSGGKGRSGQAGRALLEPPRGGGSGGKRAAPPPLLAAAEEEESQGPYPPPQTQKRPPPPSPRKQPPTSPHSRCPNREPQRVARLARPPPVPAGSRVRGP